MATNKYKLHITSHGSDIHFEVTYKNGKFLRLTKLKGKFADQKQKSGLFHVVPENEKNIDQINTDFKDRVVFTPVEGKAKTPFTVMMDAFIVFYESKTQLKPRIGATEGKALNMIIKHMKDIGLSPEESIEVWKMILFNWDRLSDFYQNQLELRQINSNLNIILRELKHGAINKKGNVTDSEMDKAFFERYGNSESSKQ